MSRARPLDKQRLVKLLQTEGEVVAVTGDGTNDAPALNFAQVACRWGRGLRWPRKPVTLHCLMIRSVVLSRLSCGGVRCIRISNVLSCSS